MNILCSSTDSLGACSQVQTLSKAAKSSKRLHWLDFASDLLTPDGSKLNPDLQFDGTHMAPVYVQYLNAQLSII